MVFRVLLLAAASLVAAEARASGPYRVDDSAITPAGTGQVEGWLSLSHDTEVLNLVPATTFTALPTVEWTLAFNGTRLADTARTDVAVQAKWQLVSEEVHPVGIALTGNISTDTRFRGPVTLFGYAAATWNVTDQLMLHGNVGWTGTPDSAEESALTWGARAEAAIVPGRLAFHAEAFGTSTAGEGFQIGLRPTNRSGNFDLELIFGRNLSGERNNWVTLGFAVRF